MPHPVDVHVGQRLRQRRWMLGLTQSHLAGRVGIRFQQIQKYETGENRMSAGRLWDVAAALGVPVAFFYEGLDGAADHGADHGADVGFDTGADPDAGEAARAGLLADREATELVRAFHAMPETQRQHLFDLARVLSGDG